MASNTKGGDLPRIPDPPSIMNCWSGWSDESKANIVNGRKIGRFSTCFGLELIRSPDFFCGFFTFLIVLVPSIVHIIFV